MRRHAMLLPLAAVLLLTLSVPAVAKRGDGGPPSGAGLEVTAEPSSGFEWGNSVGDRINFDITVTNRSGGALTGVSVAFTGTVLTTVDLGKNKSWDTQYTYTVLSDDLDGLEPNAMTSVSVGIVTAAVAGEIDSADAIMTAYPVPTCEREDSGAFTFTATDDYAVCSFTAEPNTNWTLTTTLPKPPPGKRPLSPTATVRDGVPGNWCMEGDPSLVETEVVQSLYFPPIDTDGNIVCLHGGAGGDTIPVRNADTFYLATWMGNTVSAEPNS